MRAVRLVARLHARVRGDGALRAHVGRGVRRRAQGDVHVRRPRRPLAHAAAGGHRPDRPRLRRARPRPGAAAGQGVRDRADVPLLAAGPRPLPRALAAVARGDRLGRSRRRRRGDPVLLGAAAAARRDRVGAAAQLDRRRELPSAVRRAPERVARRASRAACDEEIAHKRATSVLQVFDVKNEQVLRRARRRAEDRRLALRRLPRALRRGQGAPRRLRRPVRARPGARARARLLHAHDLRVRRAGGERQLDDLRRRALRRARRGGRRAGDPGHRVRRRSRAAPARDGAGGRDRGGARGSTSSSPSRSPSCAAGSSRRSRRGGRRAARSTPTTLAAR